MSSKQRKTPIPPHNHCKVCGRAVPEGRVHCSPECKEKDLKMEKRAKRMNLIFLLMLVALAILMLVSYRMAPSS